MERCQPTFRRPEEACQTSGGDVNLIISLPIAQINDLLAGVHILAATTSVC